MPLRRSELILCLLTIRFTFVRQLNCAINAINFSVNEY